MTRIKDLRQTAGITQQQLAESIGVTQAAVAQWESGLTSPKFAHLRAIAEKLGCSVDDLIGEEAC